MRVKIKRLKPDAILPTYAHPGDVGMDLYSLEDYELKTGERKIFLLGLCPRQRDWVMMGVLSFHTTKGKGSRVFFCHEDNIHQSPSSL